MAVGFQRSDASVERLPPEGNSLGRIPQSPPAAVPAPFSKGAKEKGGNIMAKAKKPAPDKHWWVSHPEHATAVVSAPSWELATVEAARWWDAPWREVAALCECQRTEKVRRNVCLDCGMIFHGESPVCAKCAVVRRDEELRRKARAKRFYREAMPRRKEGQI